jgi:calcineurin-like phosphoesterase family protein
MQWPWLISDTHFGHRAIIEYEKRPFQDCIDMEKTIINNWNSVVKKEDRVFHLGDFAFHPLDVTKKIVEQLNGQIYLVQGNHDTHSVNWYRDCGIKECVKYPILMWKFLLLSHEPLYLEKTTPYRNVHGHIHGNRTLSNKHFNVSVENINYTPISLKEVLKQIELDFDITEEVEG